MKKLVSLLLAGVFSVSAMGMISTPVQAACQRWDLVDSGKHLDYDGNSAYMNLVPSCVSVWNNHKPGVIRPDSVSVIEDVFIKDYYVQDTTLGVTSSAGTIKLNSYQYSSMTTAQRKKTIIHELGHALGLDHTSGTNDVMRQGILNTNSLSSTDKSSYNSCYNHY